METNWKIWMRNWRISRMWLLMIPLNIREPMKVCPPPPIDLHFYVILKLLHLQASLIQKQLKNSKIMSSRAWPPLTIWRRCVGRWRSWGTQWMRSVTCSWINWNRSRSIRRSGSPSRRRRLNLIMQSEFPIRRFWDRASDFIPCPLSPHRHNVEDPPEHEKKTKDIPANLVIGDKKKKRNPSGRNDINDFEDELGAGHFEPLNENYMGGRDSDLGVHECPILDSIERRCRGVDVISGDIHQEFLSVCAKHQICYLCVSISPVWEWL